MLICAASLAAARSCWSSADTCAAISMTLAMSVWFCTDTRACKHNSTCVHGISPSKHNAITRCKLGHTQPAMQGASSIGRAMLRALELTLDSVLRLLANSACCVDRSSAYLASSTSSSSSVRSACRSSFTCSNRLTTQVAHGTVTGRRVHSMHARAAGNEAGDANM